MYITYHEECPIPEEYQVVPHFILSDEIKAKLEEWNVVQTAYAWVNKKSGNFVQLFINQPHSESRSYMHDRIDIVTQTIY